MGLLLATDCEHQISPSLASLSLFAGLHQPQASSGSGDPHTFAGERLGGCERHYGESNYGGSQQSSVMTNQGPVLSERGSGRFMADNLQLFFLRR
jgi:hypothetical protein